MIINDKRALAHVQVVTDIKPIAGADNIELIQVLGWFCIAKIGEFHVGDKAVYIEIDSKVPASDERFAFLERKGYKVKTYKLNKFGVVSQGLALPLTDFPELDDAEVGTDVTEALKIVYAVAEDNKRKAEVNPLSVLKQRKAALFKKPFIKWLMKYRWGRKVILLIWGRKSDSKTAFPTHMPFIKKTDQERVENIPWILENKTPFIKTQKCDGSSGTFILERKCFNKYEFYVCSRNVRQLNINQQCYFDENYYWEVAIKYDIEKILKRLMQQNKHWKYCAIQGEICSPKIQGNPHALTETQFFVFHFIDSEKGKYDIRDVKFLCDKNGLLTVPISDENYILPNTIEEIKEDANFYYDPSCCQGKSNRMAEGWVYYSTKDPNFSFKNVSREYLLQK